MHKGLLVSFVVLLVAIDARAQPPEAPAPATTTVQVQTCSVVPTIYGLWPVCTTMPMDPAEVDRSVADYLTNGASAAAAPSAGPGAAYFHDAARVLAAPTSWIPSFSAAAPAPTGGTSAVAPPPEVPDAGGLPPPPVAAQPAATPVSSADTSAPSPATQATASWSIDETPSATLSSTTSPPATVVSTTSPSAVPSVAATEVGARRAVAPDSTEPRGVRAATVAPRWVVVFRGLVVAGVLLVLLSIAGRWLPRRRHA